jgi:hypothetical protein
MSSEIMSRTKKTADFARFGECLAEMPGRQA